jgi:hypothetical protein
VCQQIAAGNLCLAMRTLIKKKTPVTYKSHLPFQSRRDKNRAAEEPAGEAGFRGGWRMIPETHPLQQLFIELVGRHYAEEIGIRDPQIVNYVAHLMAEFCEVEQLFKIRNSEDQPIADVGEMLIESNPVYGPAPSFDRERQVRKHIGDYTLFFAGMFPESINHYRLRHNRTENFVDWIKAGKESYYIVSKFEHFEYTKVAPLFASLSSHFEQCVYGLNQVKNDLQEMQHPIVRRTNEILM